MANQFVGYDNIIPLVAPVAGTTGTITSPYMNLKNAQKASFLISFGAVTSTTATDHMLITVEAATAEAGTEAQIDFRYRLSGAVGVNTWGAVVTVAAATGCVAITGAAGDDTALWVEVDPDALAASDYTVVRFLATPTVSMEAYVIGAVGILEARYKQTTHISATASASA